jgi:hypothetical protein
MLEARVNLGSIPSLLRSLANPDLRPAFREASKPLRADIRDHGKKQRSETGTWAPPAASTMARRAAGRRKRARKPLGKLPTALMTKASRRGLYMASRAAWSEIQRSGGRANHGAHIPARDWMWISDLALDAVGYIIVRVMAKAFG